MQVPAKPAAFVSACVFLCLSACDRPSPHAAPRASACGAGGQLVAEIYGSVRASIDWEGEMLECEGMPRPDGEGARLHFAGHAVTAGEKHRLAFIFGLPDLVEGKTGKELPTNVTMIEEGTGQFFATRDTDSCWTDIDSHERMHGAGASEYRISGVLYCLGPLANLTDNSSISFSDLRFAGRLDWKAPE